MASTAADSQAAVEGHMLLHKVVAVDNLAGEEGEQHQLNEKK